VRLIGVAEQLDRPAGEQLGPEPIAEGPIGCRLGPKKSGGRRPIATGKVAAGGVRRRA